MCGCAYVNAYIYVYTHVTLPVCDACDSPPVSISRWKCIVYFGVGPCTPFTTPPPSPPHYSKGTHSLIEVSLCLFHVTGVVVEGEANLAAGEGAEGSGRAQDERGYPALKGLRDTLRLG